MASTVSQRISLDLQPAISISDKLDALYDILSGVAGFEGLYWGYNLENLTQIEILLFWSSLESYSAFQGTTEQFATSPILDELSTTAPMVHNLSFQPSKAIILSPVVELLLLSLSATPAPCAFDAMLDFMKSSDGCMGATAGLVREEGDEVDNLFLFVVGWESIDANEQGAKSAGFKTFPKVQGAKVLPPPRHVRFQKVED